VGIEKYWLLMPSTRIRENRANCFRENFQFSFFFRWALPGGSEGRSHGMAELTHLWQAASSRGLPKMRYIELRIKD
jgi:hypothetical protein